MSETNTGMKYMDGELYELIQDFEELGDFDNSREAQRKLARAVRGLPLNMLLVDDVQQDEKVELNVPSWGGGPNL